MTTYTCAGFPCPWYEPCDSKEENFKCRAIGNVSYIWQDPSTHWCGLGREKMERITPKLDRTIVKDPVRGFVLE